MTTDKLNQIIERKNEQLERHAISRATEIIESIASLQQEIAESNEQIAQLRAELKTMEIQQINPISILG